MFAVDRGALEMPTLLQPPIVNEMIRKCMCACFACVDACLQQRTRLEDCRTWPTVVLGPTLSLTKSEHT